MGSELIKTLRNHAEWRQLEGIIDSTPEPDPITLVNAFFDNNQEHVIGDAMARWLLHGLILKLRERK